jgi:hypothetical protein
MLWFMLIVGTGFVALGGVGLLRSQRAGGRQALEPWSQIIWGAGVTLQAIGLMRRLPNEDPASALFFTGGLCMLFAWALQWRAWRRRLSAQVSASDDQTSSRPT